MAVIVAVEANTPPRPVLEPLPVPATQNSMRRGVCFALLGLCLVVLLARLHTYNEPLERDITSYAVIAHQIIGGKTLYDQVWDHKPPAIHMTYAIAEGIVGYGRNAILLINVAAAVATLIGCYFAGSAVDRDPLSGLLAAAIWALVSGDLGLEANQPNTEVFINALLMGGFALVLRTGNSNRNRRSMLMAGLLFAIASLYKQIAIIPVALLCLTYIALAPSDARKKAVADVIYISTVGACVWALVFGYFAVVGRLDTFIDATFIYNQSYAGSILSNLTRSLRRPALPVETLVLLGLLATLSVVGLVSAALTERRRHWALLMAVIAGTHLAVLLPGQFFAHYYQLWLPPLAVGAAWTVSLLLRQKAIVDRPWLRRLAPALVVASFAIIELPYYLLPAEGWSFRKYGPIFIEADGVARQLDNLLQENETFYEWGSETGLYFESKRNPPTGLFFADPLLTGPLREELWLKVAADLDRTRPDVIVLERTTVARTPRTHPILAWVKQEYRPISKGGMFLLLARKGSRIERRYAANDLKPSA
jgi:hypothetical protein